MTTLPCPRTLEEALALFNRKERFILLDQATGALNHLHLGAAFARDLSKVLGLTVPAGAYIAMDYHFDWLYAAIQTYLGRWSSDGGVLHAFEGQPVHAPALTASQEDADLVVAWDDGKTRHLVLIEAKAYSGWTNAQLESKICRLRQIFDEDGRPISSSHTADEKHRKIRGHFVLAGFSRSAGIRAETWPAWTLAADGRPHFLRLQKPPERWGVQRTDADGKPWTAPADQMQYWSLRRFPA